jgi:hypothetical protein
VVKARDRLLKAVAPQLILIDDEALRVDDRAWLLERIRQQAPRTFVIYVAANMTPKPKRAPGRMGPLLHVQAGRSQARDPGLTGIHEGRQSNLTLLAC